MSFTGLLTPQSHLPLKMALTHRKKNKHAEDGDADAEKQRQDEEEKKSRLSHVTCESNV